MLTLGDVSGKAAPAALYAALVSGILRSLAPRRLPPARLLAALNDALQERKLDSQYVTMLVALWDDATRTLHLANAGSVQPLLVTRHEGKLQARTIPIEGFPLGLFPGVTYEEIAFPLRPGDTVVFFSDGIVDALNQQGEQFGNDRLCTLLHSTPTASVSQLAALITTTLTTFKGRTEPFDDETLVILRAT